MYIYTYQGRGDVISEDHTYNSNNDEPDDDAQDIPDSVDQRRLVSIAIARLPREL